jgi:hypothetical protein
MKTFTRLDGGFIRAAGTEHFTKRGPGISVFALQHDDPFVVVGESDVKLMEAGDYVLYCPATRGVKAIHARHLEEFYYPLNRKPSPQVGNTVTTSEAPIGDTVSGRLQGLLENFTYESSVGRGRRGLMGHHVSALMTDLLPFIEAEVERAVKEKDSAADKDRKALAEHWHGKAA